jgi:hypothetical protein
MKKLLLLAFLLAIIGLSSATFKVELTKVASHRTRLVQAGNYKKSVLG